MNTAITMAHAIVNVSTALAFDSHADHETFKPLALTSQAPVAIKTGKNAEIYQAAKMVCLALDFIDADADCIAQAWQAQSTRTGQFDAQAWPTEPQDFGRHPWPRTDAFAPCPHQLGLYAVLPDAAWVGRMAWRCVRCTRSCCVTT